MFNICYFCEHFRFDEEKRVVTMDLTFFVEEKDGLYRRFDELHFQRAHRQGEITAWLEECGYNDISVFGDRTFSSPSQGEQRLHFTAIRK